MLNDDDQTALMYIKQLSQKSNKKTDLFDFIEDNM